MFGHIKQAHCAFSKTKEKEKKSLGFSAIIKGASQGGSPKHLQHWHSALWD